MLKRVIEQQNPSVLMMQEVSADSQDDLARAFPDQNMAFVFGDARQKARQGGLGNIIMSKNALENIKSRKIEKITPMDSYIKGAKGLFKDLIVFDFSFPRLDRALVEDRAIIAATTEVIVGDEVEKVQVATSHIDRGDGVRQPQLETVTEFLSDIADDADSTVFCGDLNTNSYETITAFAKIGFAVIPTPHKTYIGGQKGSTVDHCAYDASGRVGYKRTTIVDEFQTDHRGIEIALKRLPGVK